MIQTAQAQTNQITNSSLPATSNPVQFSNPSMPTSSNTNNNSPTANSGIVENPLQASLKEAQKFPEGCSNEGFTYEDKTIRFNSDNSPTQRVYLISNQSARAIHLNHIKSDMGASAGWLSRIDKQQWSALAVNQPNFSLTCINYTPPNFGAISCQSIVSVCSYPATGNAGTYWVTENKPLDELLKTMQQRGIKVSTTVSVK